MENSGEELDLEQLMARIRQNAQKRKLDSFNNNYPLPYRLLKTQGADILRFQSHIPDSTLPELHLQGELERREQYQLSDLLGFHDEAFVRNAYRVILKRDPDDAGFRQYLENLRSGRYSKIDILSSLRFSAEGRNANVAIRGLGRTALFRKLYRVPVFGYISQLIVAIVRLPVLIANYRRLESHSAAQLERVAKHLNETVACLSDTNQKQMDVLKSNIGLQIKSLIREQQEITRAQDALRSDISVRLDDTADRVRQQVSIQEYQSAELQDLKSQLEERVGDLLERFQKTRMDIVQQERQLALFLEEAHKRLPDALDSGHLQVLKLEEDHLLDSLYCTLEDELRGTTDDVREQVKVYIPVLKNAGVTSDILDIGCGRGEWLEVLREAGLQARGVDQNRVLLQRCKALGLDVVESDALNYLQPQAEGSFSAVTAFHFAEHLSFESLVKFIDEVGRTLRPGGLLIVETPNPENLLVGSCNFYLDPTHKNPIPIATMKLLLEARGFCCQDVLRLNPVSSVKIEVKDQLTSHLNHYLYGPMNYAIVARKPETANG